MVKIGDRLACDKCGRVESSKFKVYPLAEPTEQIKHICENCRQKIYYEHISVVSKNSR